MKAVKNIYIVKQYRMDTVFAETGPNEAKSYKSQNTSQNVLKNRKTYFANLISGDGTWFHYEEPKRKTCNRICATKERETTKYCQKAHTARDHL